MFIEWTERFEAGPYDKTIRGGDPGSVQILIVHVMSARPKGEVLAFPEPHRCQRLGRPGVWVGLFATALRGVYDGVHGVEGLTRIPMRVSMGVAPGGSTRQLVYNVVPKHMCRNQKRACSAESGAKNRLLRPSATRAYGVLHVEVKSRSRGAGAACRRFLMAVAGHAVELMSQSGTSAARLAGRADSARLRAKGRGRGAATTAGCIWTPQGPSYDF